MTFFSLSIHVVLYFGMMIDAMMYARIPDPPIKEKMLIRLDKKWVIFKDIK